MCVSVGYVKCLCGMSETNLPLVHSNSVFILKGDLAKAEAGHVV